MACPAPSIVHGSGHTRWSGERDNDGHYTYRIVHRVRVDDSPGSAEGPATALRTPGLPLPGSLWTIDGEVDLNAVCQWDAKATPVIDERMPYWDVEQIFTTRPSSNCRIRSGTGTGTGNTATDPLAEPPKVSGNFIKYTEEKTHSYLGDPFQTSSHEQIRGPLVEFDSSRLTFRITINEASLDLQTKIALIDTVNTTPFYDFAYRTVKLSNITWQQLYYADCQCYFETTYEFEVNPEGFDREALDEGTKALKGQWNKTTGVWELVNINGSPPSASNPSHFVRITDFYGNPMRAILNGAGVPATNISGTGTADQGRINIEYYDESEFNSIAGLPNDLECAA